MADVGVGNTQVEHTNPAVQRSQHRRWGTTMISLPLCLRSPKNSPAQPRRVDRRGARAPAAEERLVAVDTAAPQAELIENELGAGEVARRLLGREPLAARAPRSQPVPALVADHLAHPRVSP